MTLLQNLCCKVSSKDKLAERILSDLNQAFRRSIIDCHNPIIHRQHDHQNLNENGALAINEFSILPHDDLNQQNNKSPVIHIDNKLALESWCLPRLFRYVTSQLLEQRDQWFLTYQYTLLDEYSRTIVLLCPDYSTAWNVRRQLVIDKYLNYANEMQFTELVVKRKPKSDDIYSYRQWLLKQIFTPNNGHEMNVENTNLNYYMRLLKLELKFCHFSSSLYRRNYYSWSYATWIITNLKTLLPNVIESNFQHQLLLSELNSSQQWINSNISDYSCFHYRQILLKILMPTENSFISDDSYRCLIEKEINLIDDWHRLYPFQESLLLHRKAILILATNCNRKTNDDWWSKLMQRENLFQSQLKSLINTHSGQGDTRDQDRPIHLSLYKIYISGVKRARIFYD